MNSAGKTRKRLRQQIASELKPVVETINRVAPELESLSRSSLSHVEALTKVTEALMASLLFQPAAGERELLPYLNLVRECRLSSNAIEQTSRSNCGRIKAAVSLLVGQLKRRFFRNCYFCSLSAPRVFFSWAYLTGGRRVKACASCRNCLKQTREVKTIYFTDENRSVHWSEYWEKLFRTKR